MTPAALVVLEQRVRPDARDTLDYFAEQKVSVKVISGDNAVSVGAVAGSLGPARRDRCDARKLPDEPDELADTLEEYTTFGRVRPDQKRAMVHALQSRGHTVAMTGDGVNDVLALKDADIGVAMGSGSPATRAVAQIVLLDNKFATLPYVVGEGRRVIGNIERVSNLFLTKTVYSVLLAVLVGLAGLSSADLRLRSAAVPVPAHPRHDRGLVHHRHPGVHPVAGAQQRAGAPGLRAPGDALGAAVGRGHRHRHVHLLPAGLPGPRGHAESSRCRRRTAALITLLMIAVWVLAVVARPYEWWRVALVAVSGLAYVVIFSIPLAQKWFMLDPSNVAITSMALGIGVVGAAVIEVLWWVQGARMGERRPLWR